MVHEEETVQVTLINCEGAGHGVVVDDFAARSTFAFPADKVDAFFSYCSVPAPGWRWRRAW